MCVCVCVFSIRAAGFPGRDHGIAEQRVMGSFDFRFGILTRLDLLCLQVEFRFCCLDVFDSDVCGAFWDPLDLMRSRSELGRRFAL